MSKFSEKKKITKRLFGLCIGYDIAILFSVTYFNENKKLMSSLVNPEMKFYSK